MSEPSPPAKLSQGEKLVLDLAPMALFFAANWKWGLLGATAVLIPASFVALAITWFRTRTINKFTLASAIFLGIFGGITLLLHDTFYLKLKVTVTEALFAAVLLGGLWFNRMFIRDLMGEVIEMPDEAWRKLTLRWGLFFAFMAVANVVVWKLFSENVWVSFKAFGIMAATVLFAFANAPFMAKHIKDGD